MRKAIWLVLLFCGTALAQSDYPNKGSGDCARR